MADDKKPTNQPEQVLILLSGGIDSAALIPYYLSNDNEARAIFIDYGQKARQNEALSAEKIANYYKINLKTIKYNTEKKFGAGEIKGRNAVFVLAALIDTEEIKGLISIGIHSDTPYYDCSQAFVTDINKILSGYCGGKILLDAPFLEWDKKRIFEYCVKVKVPLKLTYSCENGGVEPCGYCLSCLDRRALDVS